MAFQQQRRCAPAHDSLAAGLPDKIANHAGGSLSLWGACAGPLAEIGLGQQGELFLLSQLLQHHLPCISRLPRCRLLVHVTLKLPRPVPSEWLYPHGWSGCVFNTCM